MLKYYHQTVCAHCGGTVPNTSHWHVGNYRFCNGVCYKSYCEADILSRRSEIVLEIIPTNPQGVWGSSPKR